MFERTFIFLLSSFTAVSVFFITFKFLRLVQQLRGMLCQRCPENGVLLWIGYFLKENFFLSQQFLRDPIFNLDIFWFRVGATAYRIYFVRDALKLKC